MRYLAKDEKREGFDILTYFKSNNEYTEVIRGKHICFSVEVDILKNGIVLDEQHLGEIVLKYGREDDFFSSEKYYKMVHKGIKEAKIMISDLVLN